MKLQSYDQPVQNNDWQVYKFIDLIDLFDRSPHDCYLGPFYVNGSLMPAIFFNYQSSTASAILKPCIDFHFSTYVFLRLTCFQNAGLPSQSSCAKSMSWWLQNPLKFQFSTLLKILQPSFGKAKLIPMALFVCSIIFCVSYKAFWWKWFFECIAPGIELNTMQWLLLPSVGIFHQSLPLNVLLRVYVLEKCRMFHVFNTFVLKGYNIHISSLFTP